MRVFVTRELFPFTAGGIGRVIANILMASTPAELAGTTVIYTGSDLVPAQFNAVYPGVGLRVACGPNASPLSGPASDRFPPLEAYTDTVLHGESVAALQQLLELERNGAHLDYVEFADWGGAAFASTQEKLLGRHLKATTIAVRLHTTDSLLAAYEARSVDIHGLAVHDLERKALADCDLLVAQLETVSEKMRSFYGFEHAAWNPRVVVDPPPVLLDHVPFAGTVVQVTPTTPITFTSKIQHVKRAEVFVDGVVAFMSATPSYLGQVKFLAHTSDQTYLDRLKSAIPEALTSRFEFLDGLKGEARERVISGSVCVFPSAWESFCLAAHEAGKSGAVCVVNGENVAFAEGTPWVDGVNCHKFDGTSASLAAALTRVFERDSAKLTPMGTLASSRPWEVQPDLVENVSEIEPKLELFLLVKDDGANVLSLLDRAIEVDLGRTAVAILDNGSSGALNIRVLDQLSRLEGVRTVRAAAERPWSDLIREAVATSDADIVAFLECGTDFDPAFLRDAVRALARNPDYGFVTCAMAIDEEKDLNQSAGDGFRHNFVYLGEARCAGLYENRYSGNFFVVRRALLLAHPLRSGLPFGQLWEFFMRLVTSGVRGIVDARICCVQSKPSVFDCPIEFAAPASLGHNELLRDKQVSFGRIQLPLYVVSPRVGIKVMDGSLGAGGAAYTVSEGNSDVRLAEYENSEVVRIALKIAIFLDQRAPFVLNVARWAARKAGM